ncbi:hypothetical protein SLA2020_154450 [Shorea laevis]
MTLDRCQRRKKMMGRGADGGCGTEERPCRPVSRVPGRNPTSQTEDVKKCISLDIDFFSQARKALCERSPYDVPENGSVSALDSPTLPSRLASFLKQSDSRKRHKKSHSSADKKSSRQSEKARGGNIWAETEEYFKDLALPDIDTLFQLSSHGSLAARKSFFIPYVDKDRTANVTLSANVGVELQLKTGPSCGDTVTLEFDNANCVAKEDANGVAKEDVKEDSVHLMEIDNAGAKEEKETSTLDLSSGTDWLLGSRSRVLLTSERPSKKRKLLGSDAGLEKLLLFPPCDSRSFLCHFCCTGDTGNESNKLIICSSCKVSAHQKCYGVQNIVDGSWLCSWCKQKKDCSDSLKPCVLCPKQGGALKPIQKSLENEESTEFAHLFCSLWMPEVYVEDLTKMEPIINLRGIKETRRKLVCNVCKVKYGVCVRCSHGTCRTSFHPMCAREARHRMEVWGKYGCDNVELRAFCLKHSDVQDQSRSQQLGDPCVPGSDSSFANHLPGVLPMNKTQKLKLGLKNGDRIAMHIETPDNSSGRSGDTESWNGELLDTIANAGVAPECDAHQLIDVGLMKRSKTEDINLSDSQNLALILKLIDLGKVNVKDIASEIGISPDSLSEKLADDNLAPDLQCQIVKWLREHAYMGTSERKLLVKIKSLISSRDGGGAADISEDVVLSEDDMTDPVAVKSVPPRRRTKNNIRILRDKKVTCSSDENLGGNGIVTVDCRDEHLQGISEDSSKTSISDATEKSLTKPDGVKESLVGHSPKCKGGQADPPNQSISKRCHLEEAAASEKNMSGNSDQGNPVCSFLNPVEPDKGKPICSIVNPVLPGLIKDDGFPGLYVHPYIEKLFTMQSLMLSNSKNSLNGGKEDVFREFDGAGERDVSRREASCNASICCNHHGQQSKCNDMICKSDPLDLKQLDRAENMGVLELSPEDEVEGEIIYYQHRLLGKVVTTDCLTDNLVHRVAKTLPDQVESARQQRWDAVLVNQYLHELKEAKKQGRKERKHKEAQAVLAAATAAAAASSRSSSSRKDVLEDPGHHENMLKLNNSSGRAGVSSQPIPWAKEKLSKVAGPKSSSDKYSDFIQSVSDISKEHPRSCDICRRSEMMLNPILVCSSCKVAVHSDCYCNVKESTGPWCCELCAELLSSRSPGAPSVNFWDKPLPVAECALCGGTTGAFRKSVDGQWVHAFCAEWVLESSFRRGQVNPVQGMETVSKGIDVCCICRRKHGVCIKCSYGHCQTTFHPSCARSSGFFMNVKGGGGKCQHKAYCEKHSLEQRAKAETQRHRIEEFRQMKQTRVELERLRLLCERIIKREKLKRELVLCSHEILACKRDHVTRSVLVHSPFLLPEVSSESATTSLKAHTDGGYKSYSEAVQRSDDVTVDSTLSVRHGVKVPVSMDTDQRTDDSSTSQNLFTPKPTERLSFSGKQIPHRYSLASGNLLDSGGWSSSSRKHIETFEKELVMTSDEASMKNSRLPKGYCYVPVDRLPKEEINPAASGGSVPYLSDCKNRVAEVMAEVEGSVLG